MNFAEENYEFCDGPYTGERHWSSNFKTDGRDGMRPAVHKGKVGRGRVRREELQAGRRLREEAVWIKFVSSSLDLD